MLRVVSRAGGLALCVQLSVLFCTGLAKAEVTRNLEIFRAQVHRYVKSMRIKLPVSVSEGRIFKGFIAKTECKGVAADIRCAITARHADLAQASPDFIEYMAVHETCHIKLRHYDLSLTDHITRSEEIERDADRCARQHIGWDKFIPSMIHLLIASNRQYEKIPIAALTRAIRKVYSDGD
jgi:hypothetical protein